MGDDAEDRLEALLATCALTNAIVVTSSQMQNDKAVWLFSIRHYRHYASLLANDIFGTNPPGK